MDRLALLPARGAAPVRAAAACGASGAGLATEGPPPAPPAASGAPVGLAELTAPAAAGAPTAGDDGGALSSSPCPADMAYVDTTYCPKVKLRCLKDEYNKPNHITICHEFAPGQQCLEPERRQRFCIDKYEYPDVEGGHPPVMVDWYDGMAACRARGKRLCWESEWVAACEGPEKLPFPYGLERDADKCNIDNPWLQPNLDEVYATNPRIADPELIRLDQSVPSGKKAGCVSGFGVHDLTGNVDEWVMSEVDRGDSKWAGLKGGAWGHVRNACRPITSSHPPEFTYYFISFRCCSDAAGAPEPREGPAMWKAPPVPFDKKKPGKISAGWTPPH